jgi:hypothetical protein
VGLTGLACCLIWAGALGAGGGGAASQGSRWPFNREGDSAVSHADDVEVALVNVDAEVAQGFLGTGLSNGDARLGGGGGDAFLHVDERGCGDGRGLGGGSVLDAGERGRDQAASSGEDGGHLQNAHAQGVHADSSQARPSCMQEDDWFAEQAEQLKKANELAKQQLCQER